MILSNYWNYKGLFPLSNKITLKKTDGTNADYEGFDSSNYSFASVNNGTFFKNLKLCVGTGTTQPTLADYVLANDTSSIISAQTWSAANTSKGVNISVIATLTNNTENDISVSEFGIIKEMYVWNTNNSKQDVLMMRAVINPIVIPAGETVVLNYIWKDYEKE